MGSHTSTETGSNYDEIEIESGILLAYVLGPCRVGFALPIP